jgi:acetate kinase
MLFEMPGYRVVHPGAEIQEQVRITDEILKKLEVATSFAPLHDPEAVEVPPSTIGSTRKQAMQIPWLIYLSDLKTIFNFGETQV